MLRALIALLVLASWTLAQPLEGPYTVYTSPLEGATLSTPHLVGQGNDGVTVIFAESSPGWGAICRAGDYSSATHELTGVNGYLGSSGTLTVKDAIADGAQSWVAAVYEQTDSCRLYGVNPNASTVLFADVWHGHPWYGGSQVTAVHFAARQGGGTVLTSEVEFAWGIESDFWANVYVFPHASLQADWFYSFVPYNFAGETGGYCAVSTHRDSVALLTSNSAGSDWNFLPPPADSLPRKVPLLCPWISALGELSSGELRALVRNDSALTCRAPALDGNCLELGAEACPDYDYRLEATAWNPACGFAVLLADSTTLYLARMDFNGQEVQAAELLHRSDHGFRRGDAGLFIQDSVVYAAWTERAVAQPGVARLQMVSVGWTTMLGVNQPHSVSPPSSFSLTAYPNPFNSTLEIQYQLPRAQRLELAVYNLLGQKVATLFEGMKTAETHAETWAPQCGTGIYFITLKNAETVRTTKVVYLR